MRCVPMSPAPDPAVEAVAAPCTLPAYRSFRAFRVVGVVQGVGFRPFAWRLAAELRLDGVMRNAGGRVEAELAGRAEDLDAFAIRLRSNAPPLARVEAVHVRDIPGGCPAAGSGVTIEESIVGASAATAASVAAGASVDRLFPPDIATCDDCLRELFDPADRRYRYPFTNCTNCGPRATIVDDLPYDRARTSMSPFPLCPDCEREYRDPADRRFHAEPVACPACGPRLAYRCPGEPAPTRHEEAALSAAAADLRAGRIVAIKGLGGYHLACDATNAVAVDRLRDRKRRWAKPFAVMVRDLAAAGRLARVTSAEATLLLSPARPIVLVRPTPEQVRPEPGELARLVHNVTNGNGRVGLFLPYTPLHHLLLEAVGGPIVLTSANLADEPLVTDDAEALVRLAGLADAFLGHDRVIRARYDDSVTRVVGTGRGARESIIRRARGYAPAPVDLPIPLPPGEEILAVGAELKHTFALARGSRAHVSTHIGDLEDLLTHRAFEENLAHLSHLLALEPGRAVHDLHPAYLSTQFAVDRFPSGRRMAVQHHHAHVASCAAEHGVTNPFIGIAYDGLGMGDDGTFWGGEILIANLAGYRRFARFGRAPMPGGAIAVRKPYRMALGYLFGAERLAPDAAWDSDVAGGLGRPLIDRLDPREVDVVRIQIARNLNSPQASSAGRLFDAASSLIGLRDVAEFEAQAAMDLETAAESDATAAGRQPLPYRIVRHDGMLVYDPRATLAALLHGVSAGDRASRLASRFQETVATVTRELCAEARRETGISTVCLSGGVLQNAWLSATLVRRLGRDGFTVHINEQVPANDGGIAYGQSAIAAARLAGMAGMASARGGA